MIRRPWVYSACVVCLVALFGVRSMASEPLPIDQALTAMNSSVYDMHVFALYVCVVITLLVCFLLFYSVMRHRKSKQTNSLFHKKASVEMIWNILPFIILLASAYPAAKYLLDMDNRQVKTHYAMVQPLIKPICVFCPLSVIVESAKTEIMNSLRILG